MPNPFTKYSPTQYVPGYVPAPIDQYASAISDIEQQHRSNIIAYNELDIALANVDLGPNDEWIREEAKAGIEGDLSGIVENGRWKDATYLLPQVYKKHFGANKDLIHAEKQTLNVAKAKDMAMQLGPNGINFKPWENFSSIDIDPQTGEKIYNTYDPDVEQRTDRIGDIKSVFDDTVRRGGTSGLSRSSNPLFLQYTQTQGIQPGEYANVLANSYEAFKQTPSYQQMIKEFTNDYTSPYGGALSPEDADKEILRIVDNAGREFMGSSQTHYTQDPYMANVLSSMSKKTTKESEATTSGALVLPTNENRNLRITGKTSKIKIKDGKPIRWSTDEEIVASQQDLGPLGKMAASAYSKVKGLPKWTALAGMLTGFGALPGLAMGAMAKYSTKWGLNALEGDANAEDLISDRIELTGVEREEFDHLYSILRQENPQFTDDKVMEMTADKLNKSVDASGQLIYAPYTGDAKKEMVNSGYWYNSETKGSTFSNINSLDFYDPESPTGYSKGNEFLRERFGNIQTMNPLGETRVDNPYGLVKGIAWEIIDEDGNTQHVVSEKGKDYEANITGGFLANINRAAYNDVTYMTNYPAGSIKPFMDKNLNPIDAKIFTNPEDNSLEMILPDGTRIVGEHAVLKNSDGTQTRITPAEHLYYQYLEYLNIDVASDQTY